MQARRFEHPAAPSLKAFALAAMIAAFAIGQARAQMVNPVPPTSPTFNNTPSQAAPTPPPVAPVSPAAPSGLSAPGSSVAPQVAVPPASASHDTAREDTAEAAERHRHVRAHWRTRYHRYAAVRVTGPSYYPGLGLLYPPYVNPCHFQPTFYVYYGNVPSYRCTGW
jgi:hypothetical protein